ncbi:Uncharacterised protein g6198 [Pycnogonum litorale]
MKETVRSSLIIIVFVTSWSSFGQHILTEHRSRLGRRQTIANHVSVIPTTTYHKAVYVTEQTIAMATLSERGDMIDCQLFDAGTEDERDELLNSLAIPPTKLDLDKMIEVVDSCQHVRSPRSNFVRKTSRSSSPQYLNVFSGILPGTKWCGHNNVAKHYADLGVNLEVDKCCRAHDYCPLKVQPFDRRYGVLNLGFYTKSHCMCDNMFYHCLKKTNSDVASIVGNIFFNLLKVKCLKEKFVPQTCLHERTLRHGQRICEHWGRRHIHRSFRIVSPSVSF